MEHTAIVEKVLRKLRAIYVGKGSASASDWDEFVGTRTEPGDLWSEIYASLIEDGDERKALAAGQQWIDKWRRERARTDHHHDADGQPIDSQSDQE